MAIFVFSVLSGSGPLFEQLYTQLCLMPNMVKFCLMISKIIKIRVYMADNKAGKTTMKDTAKYWRNNTPGKSH